MIGEGVVEAKRTALGVVGRVWGLVTGNTGWCAIEGRHGGLLLPVVLLGV